MWTCNVVKMHNVTKNKKNEMLRLRINQPIILLIVN